jgi:hypothetical protein
MLFRAQYVVFTFALSLRFFFALVNVSVHPLLSDRITANVSVHPQLSGRLTANGRRWTASAKGDTQHPLNASSSKWQTRSVPICACAHVPYASPFRIVANATSTWLERFRQRGVGADSANHRWWLGAHSADHRWWLGAYSYSPRSEIVLLSALFEVKRPNPVFCERESLVNALLLGGACNSKLSRDRVFAIVVNSPALTTNPENSVTSIGGC